MRTSGANGSFSSSELVWERLMAETRYGRYADGVESKMMRYVLARCPAPGVLLDVGCEGGRWSKVFGDRGWQIIATDVDARVLQICESRIPNARCVLADPNNRQLAAENDSIDVALCIEVGPVIHTDWAIPELSRVLKREGRLAGVCWNRSSWRGFLYHNAPGLRCVGSDPLVGFPIKYRNFRRQMIKHGFRFEKELGYAWGPFRRTSNSLLASVWAAFERFSGLQYFISVAPMIAFVAQKIEPPDVDSSSTPESTRHRADHRMDAPSS
jgi:SAM-dependent methyltransferase